MAGTDFITTITGNVTGFDVGPINNLSNALKTVPSAAQSASSSTSQLGTTFQQTSSGGTQLNSSLNQVTSSSNQTTGSVRGLSSGMSPLSGILANTTSNTRGLTGAFAGAGTSAAQFHGSTTPLPGALNQVASGGLNVTNMLQPLNSNMKTVSDTQKTTQESTISLGQKIGLMGGFITSSIGSVFGLIEGFTGLEAAQVAADRAQQRVNTSSLAAEKAQDLYNKQVAKFGPDSRQAQEALANLANKQEANRIAQERSEVTQKHLQEGYVSFGLSVITVAGEMAQMGSTVSILVGKLGLKTAATVVDTDANIAAGVSAAGAAAALDIEGAAAGNAAKGTDIAGFSALGLGAKFAIVAAPLIAAVALFILIETNTFKMGDAFRSVTPQIGQAIDAIVNGAALIYNAFIKSLEAIIQFGANAANAFIGLENSINKFLDAVVVGFTNLSRDIQNAINVIPKFFIDNFINPIIRAWNTFTQGIVATWQKAVNAIADFFKPAIATILDTIKKVVDAGAQLPLALGDPFRNAQKPINDAIAALAKVGTQAGQTGEQAKTGLTPLKEIPTQAVAPLQHLTTSGLYPLNTAIIDVSGVIKQLDGTIIQNAGNIKTGAGAALAYGSSWGNLSKVITGQAVPAIKGIIDPIQQTIGGLFGFGQAAATGEAKSAKLTTEMGKAAKAHKDFGDTLTNSITKLNEEAAAVQRAISAHQFAAKAIAETGKALQDAAAKQQELITKLTDGTAVQNRYNTAILEGTNKYLDLIVKTQDEVVAQGQYNDLLVASGAGTRAFALGLDATAKNMELVTKAALGDAEAMQQLQDSVKGLFDDFMKLGDEVGNKLAEGLDKGNKAFKKTLKEMEKETGIKFDPDGVFNLSVDASIRNAEKTAKEGIGLIVDDIVGGWSSGIRDANLPAEIDQLMTKLSGSIKGSSPAIRLAFQNVMNDLKAIAQVDIPTPPMLAKLKKDLDAIDPSGQLAAKAIGGLSGPLSGLAGAAGGATAAMNKYTTGTQAAIDLNEGFKRGVADASGQLFILEGIASTVFINFLTALKEVSTGFNLAFIQGVAAATVSLGVLQTNAATAFVNIVIALAQVRDGFTLAFNQGTLAAGLALNSLTANIDANAAIWITAFNAVATALVTDFNGATLAAGTVMNSLTANIDANAALWITAFNAVAVALVTDFNNATKSVGTVLNGLSTNVNGNAANWIKAFNAAATALVNDFNSGTNAAGTAMNSLATNVNTNVNNIVSRLNNVITEFNNIRTSINNAISAVNSLISRINAIPTQRTVTVTINEIHNITQVIHQVITPFSTTNTATTIPVGGKAGTTTTVLASTEGSGRTKVIRLEISEPTVVKVDGRELIKQINKKLLELDIGALV